MNTFTERDIRSGASHLRANHHHTGGRSMDRETAIRAYIDEPRVAYTEDEVRAMFDKEWPADLEAV